MTQTQSGRRRCSQCGRFLPAGSTEELCSICLEADEGSGAAQLDMSLGQHGEPPPPFPDAVRPAEGVVIPRPSQLHPDVTLPDPKPVTRPTPSAAIEASVASAPPKAEERAKLEPPEVEETPSEVEEASSTEPPKVAHRPDPFAPKRLFAPIPGPRPSAPKVTQARPLAPVAPVVEPAPALPPAPRVEAPEREGAAGSVNWVGRLVVGLAIGILVGIAVPLLLSR